MELTDYEITKRYQAKQISLGLCVNGCKRPLKTSRLCYECAKKSSEKNNVFRKKFRINLIKQGLCSTDCGRKVGKNLKWYCRKCADKLNEYGRNHRSKNIIRYRDKARLNDEKNRFNGLKPSVLDRDSHSCRVCGYSKRVIVHHINENPKDNRMENLITLCQLCHVVVERFNRTRPNHEFFLHLFPWIS